MLKIPSSFYGIVMVNSFYPLVNDHVPKTSSPNKKEYTMGDPPVSTEIAQGLPGLFDRLTRLRPKVPSRFTPSRQPFENADGSPKTDTVWYMEITVVYPLVN